MFYLIFDMEKPTSSAKNVFQSDTQEQETKQTVSAILDQIPNLLRVKQVRRSDGTIVDFAPEMIGRSFEIGLHDLGIDDKADQQAACQQKDKGADGGFHDAGKMMVKTKLFPEIGFLSNGRDGVIPPARPERKYSTAWSGKNW